MKNININAFADESSPFIDEQILALKRNGLNGIEIRDVDKVNISDISFEKAAEVRKKFDDAGLKIFSLGSPLGKITLGQEDFIEHLGKVRHTLELANILGAENVRMFSFYIPKGSNPEGHRNEVIDRLCEMSEFFRDLGIYMCHENEKGIYGDTPERCLDLFNSVNGLCGVFDPANFVQCSVDTLAAWDMLKNNIRYMHIKDALQSGYVVPSGKGVGNIPYITSEFIKMGGKDFTMEPHLTVFDALKGLERADEEIKVGKTMSFASKEEAFDVACKSFREIVEAIV